MLSNHPSQTHAATLIPPDAHAVVDHANLIPPDAQGLVFDCDGTLIDSMPLHFAAWHENCNNFGLTLTPKLLVDSAGVNIHELLAIIIQHSGKDSSEIDKEEAILAMSSCPFTQKSDLPLFIKQFFKQLMPGMYDKHHKPVRDSWIRNTTIRSI